MKKILILLPSIPYPLNCGGNQGVYHMIKGLLDYYQIHVWFLFDISANHSLINAFSESLGNKIKIHYTVKKIGFNIATLRGIHNKVDRLLLRRNELYKHNISLWGKESSSRFDNNILSDINNIIQKEDIDIVQVEFFQIIDYVYCLPSKVKKIFVHHELAFARKQTQLNQVKNKTYYDEFMFHRLFDREIAALNRYDAVIVLTDIDKEKLETNGVKKPVMVSPLCIPCDKYADFIPATNRLVFIGSGTHYPNVEGLKWFIDNVHPILTKKIQYSLDVIGTNWSLDMFQNVPENISFIGFVEDLSKIVPGSIMIVPILSGSGMRMKILESVNNSVPFVSTSVGAEGLFFSDSTDCSITDNPEVFSYDILNLLLDVSLQKKYVMNSRKVYEEKYSEKILSKRRLNVLNSINE